jgi:hypothetical protein
MTRPQNARGGMEVGLASLRFLQVIIFASVLTHVEPARAATIASDTLEQFVQKCKAVDAIKQQSDQLNGPEAFRAGFEFGQCVGYISGVLELHAVVRGIDPDAALFCLPEGGLSLNNAIKLITTYAEKHPEDLHIPIGVNLLSILVSEFPCEQSAPTSSETNRPTTHL